jgi:hypothetical protein
MNHATAKVEECNGERLRTRFTDAFQSGKHAPQGLKPAFFQTQDGAASSRAPSKQIQNLNFSAF